MARTSVHLLSLIVASIGWPCAAALFQDGSRAEQKAAPDFAKASTSELRLDVSEIRRKVGATLAKAGCPTCELAGQAFPTSDSQKEVDEVVSRGWLYFGSAEPDLLVVDSRTGAVVNFAMKEPAQSLGGGPAASPAIANRTYATERAVCAIKSERSRVVAAWTEPPLLTDQTTGESYALPDAKLRAGDIIVANVADEECIAPPNGQTDLTAVKFRLDFVAVRAGEQTQMRYFLIGDYMDGS